MILNKTFIAIIEEFSKDYSKRIYGNEIAKKYKLNQKTVSNILKKLEKFSLLKYKSEGKNKYYYLNYLNPEVEEYLNIIESYKKIKFYENNIKMLDLFKKIENLIDGILVLFGSYADFTNKKNSDIDLLIVGKVSEDEIKRLSNFYRIEINIKRMSLINFKNSLINKDFFVKEVIKKHIILNGKEQFIKFLLENYYGFR